MKELKELFFAIGNLGWLLLGMGYAVAFVLNRHLDQGLLAILFLMPVRGDGKKEE